MRLIIDIDEKDLDYPANILYAVKHGIPISDNATVCDIEDIKAEIYKERTNISFNLSEEKSKWVNSGIYDGLVWAEEIIDKYTAERR